MLSFNTNEGIIQQEHAIFKTNEVHKLKEEIHNLKPENETLKIQAVEREKKLIMSLTATSNNGGKYRNWQFVKKRSFLSNHNLQIQTSNRFFPLEETIEDWNEAENCDQEEICPNNNILRRQTEKKQCRRPEFPITEN